MHTAVSATPLLRGRKEPVDAILIHAGQLVLGGPSGTVSAYTLPNKTNDNASTTQQQTPRPRQEEQTALEKLTWAARLSKATKSIEQLKVIREANLFVTLCDATVALHDIAAVQDVGREFVASSSATVEGATTMLTSAPSVPAEATTTLVQTKGALSLAIDTSIQNNPTSSKPEALTRGGAGYRHKAGQHTIGRAYRPDDATQGRRTRGVAMGGIGTLRGTTRPMSLLGMEELQRDKEQKKKFMTLQGGRFTHHRKDEGPSSGADEVMSVVTTLAVGCRRKLIVFRWVDGAFWDTKEIHLPHTPRTLAYPTPTTLFMGYTSSEYAILTIPLVAESSVADLMDNASSAAAATIPTSSLSGTRVDLYEWKLKPLDIPLPGVSAEGGTDGGSASSIHANQTNALGAGGGMTAMAGAAFTGLTGYMGMSNKNRPLVVQVEGGEVLVCRESLGVFLNEEGKPTRRDGIEWNAIPDEVAYIKPYVLTILPPPQGRQLPAFPLLQVRSASTLVAVQSLPFPPLSHEASAQAGNYPSVRFLTPSPGNKAPLYVKVTPTERGAAEKEGSTIWCLEMKSWGKQIDELVEAGEYQEALGLLHSVDEILLEDKEERRGYIESLYAVSQFVKSHYSDAIDHFLELDTNPARVIALYPSFISGSLARDRSGWFELFGGKTIKADEAANTNVGDTSLEVSDVASIRSGKSAAQPIQRDRSRLHGLWGKRPQSIVAGDSDSLASSPIVGSPIKVGSPSKTAPSATTESKEEKKTGHASDQASSSLTSTPAPASSKSTPAKRPKPSEDERKAIDALGSFLADRRRIFKPILEQQPSSHSITMSQVKRDPAWLLALPSKPLHTLELDQLIAVAQTVDTALFKTFLATKPGLLGPLCRVENWCEVDQVEELLMEDKKYSELIALYGGKEMHDKALSLLRKMSEDEENVKEKVEPTVRYLQNLGEEYVKLIVETSHWVFSLDEDSGMDIFCADVGKVSTLPRHAVVKDLETFDERLCIRYLDHLIRTLGDGDPTLHEKLATLLIRRIEAQKDNDDDEQTNEDRKASLGDLLRLLESSHQYRAERVLNRVPTNERIFYDVRALLLGRLGQDEAALRIYVDKLHDHAKAEEYCKRIALERPTSNAFLTLLRIYLRPKREHGLQLDPALAIISRHGARVDAKAALELLPLHVQLGDVEAFAGKALRQTYARKNEGAIVAQIAKERALQLDEHLQAFHRRRVKVTERRTCPRCMKRLGNSVIAVTVDGTVLHYGCSKFTE